MNFIFIGLNVNLEIIPNYDALKDHLLFFLSAKGDKKQYLSLSNIFLSILYILNLFSACSRSEFISIATQISDKSA